MTVAYTDPDASADDANAAQDAAGNDADSFSSAIGVRSLAEWEFTVTPPLPDPDDPTIMVATLTENGDPITATATITNGVAFTTDQTVTLGVGRLGPDHRRRRRCRQCDGHQRSGLARPPEACKSARPTLTPCQCTILP